MSPISDFVLIDRVNQCPKLASLNSINESLTSLLASDDSLVSQIAEVIRLDPSLTTRVLDLVNSIFFGSGNKESISGVEEASIFLGLNRIKELLSTTPIIEEISDLGKKGPRSFSWENFWRHSVGTAILTREILAIAEHKVDMEADYISGLLHNLGIIIQAITFPDEFELIYAKSHQTLSDLTDSEENYIGWNHAKVGAYYLWNHHISENIVEAVNLHNSPHESTIDAKLCSAVHLANRLTRQLGLYGMEKIKEEDKTEYYNTPAWSLLFPKEDEKSMEEKKQLVEASMNRLKEISTHIL